MKLLSEDPANYGDAPTEGMRRILEEETGKSMPRDEKVDTSNILSIRMGTTVRLATEAQSLPHYPARLKTIWSWPLL